MKYESIELLHAVIGAATALLTVEGSDDLDSSLFEGMDIIGNALNFDRLQIWQNETVDEEHFFVLKHQWLSEYGKNTAFAHPGFKVSYNATPGWYDRFSDGGYISGPVKSLSDGDRKYLEPFKIKSTFIFPLLVQNNFWGMITFDDCHNERNFIEDELNILRSAGLMIVSTVNRLTQMNEVKRRDELLYVVNSAASLILSADEGEDFDYSLENGLDLMGRYVDVDYIELWQNEMKDGELHANLKHKWISDFGKDLSDPRISTFSYSITPKWDKRFLRGEHMNGPVSSLSKADQEFLAPFQLISTVVIPLHLQNNLWGFACIDDCRFARTFTEEEVDILRSGCMMMVSAINRNDQAFQLRQASRAKTSFLANMSHEMRTPLNAVIGLSELIMEAGGLNEEVLLNLEKISNAGATLLSTVNDILDISKIEAGKFELLPIEYDVPSLINDAITQSVMRIGEKPIKFILDIEETLPSRLFGDDLRVKQILNNLLSNAFKYTKEGTVELKIRSEPAKDGEAIFTATVRDTGTGIKAENLGRLFTDYSMMDAKANRKIEGTGLGLSITKRIAEMMGGSISVESEYGVGSVFTVIIRQLVVNETEIGPEVVSNLQNFRYSDHKRRRHAKMIRANLAYAKVLVVDDVATNLDVARGMMKPYNMQVDCVSSGKEAIEVIRDGKVRYNAVFMDHMMPEMDGIEAVRIIRADIGTNYAKTVPIIALTANAIVGNEAMFLSKGFQAFISKPIEIDRLDSVIREWVRDKELEKELEQIDIGGETILEARSGRDRRKPVERRSGHDRRNLGKTITGIDMVKGLEIFGGNEETYLYVLGSYVANTRPLLELTREVSLENLSDYGIHVHGIKSSNRSIGADPLGDRAEALEMASKNGNISFVLEKNASFYEDTIKLISDIEAYLNKISGDNAGVNPAPKKDSPDPGLLNRLLIACEKYNMDDVDAVMGEIESFEYTADDGLVKWLRENVSRMNFMQIIERLKEV